MMTHDLEEICVIQESRGQEEYPTGSKMTLESYIRASEWGLSQQLSLLTVVEF